MKGEFDGIWWSDPTLQAENANLKREVANLKKALGEQTEAVKKWRNRARNQRKRRKVCPKCARKVED